MEKEFEKQWKRFLICERGVPSAKDTGVSSETDDKIIRIPKFRISEQWGTPGTEDREIIEKFTSKIQGSTLKEKINSLNSFVSDCDAGCAAQKNVAEILANLVFLDSLAAVIEDFNPMTGGFLFESLIASLFGGSAKQVPTQGGIDQDVTDITDDQGRPMSLKFFFEGGSQYIHGSEDNLRNAIIKNKQPMYYLIGLKNKSTQKGKVVAIDFYEFSVGSSQDGIEGQFDVWQIGSYNGLSIGEVIGRKQRGRPRRGEEGKPRTRQKETAYYLGTLNFGSKDQLQAVAKNYVTRLGSLMFEIYEQLDLLSKNINKYFLDTPGGKDAALSAINNAAALKTDLQKL